MGKTNSKPYTIIEPGTTVVMLTYMVGLIPDGDQESEYDPFPVHLRKLPEEVAEVDVIHPDEDLQSEILRRADKLERRNHPTAEERQFSIGHLRLVRQKLDVAR